MTPATGKRPGAWPITSLEGIDVANGTCSIAGCGGSHFAFGWCQKHYTRWRRHGSTDDPRAPKGPRRCSRCGSPGPFRKRARSRDGLQGYCKPCSDEAAKRSRETPRGRAKDIRHSKEQQRRRGERFSQLKLERGCADCGYKAHPAALQWDHVRGTKRFNVGTGARTKSPVVVLAEIEKCEVVCANCHAVRTFERGQHRRSVKPQEALW